MKSMEEIKRLRKMSYGEMANLFREKERSGQSITGYSIYGSAIDGSDWMVRLEGYMRDEKGGEDGWQIEACYVDEPDDLYKQS